MAGDHGALTCSHLQSYDPDRALTDYISRLEALQRRLGSVTSGNTYSMLCSQLCDILIVYIIYSAIKLAFTGDFLQLVKKKTAYLTVLYVL